MISTVLHLLTAGLEAWSVWWQYRLRDYLNTRYKQISKELNEINNEIIRYRELGRDADADRLLFQQAYLSSLRASTARGLSVFAARPVVLVKRAREVGQPESSGGEGPADSGTNRSTGEDN